MDQQMFGNQRLLQLYFNELYLAKGNCNDGNSNILTYSDMFERGSACNDDENRCSFVNTTQVMTDFSFSRDKNRDLPANFFCIFNFNQPSDYSNFLI